MAAAERRTDERIPRSNLPVAPTPLVGREREINDARARLLCPEIRLLTFTGPGGTGKTRLALAVAASLTETFADGVHFVDLAPLRDPTLVHATIAHSLGIRDAGDQPLLETLQLYLQSRELLLLLDNFEQVIDAAPLVSDLLAAGPTLKIAVTSREPLHLSWEHEWPVPPLVLPPADVVDRDHLTESSAVTLFVERARASKPDFELTDANARIVADICARLDGLPLAIELAAARVKLLPLATIHARLQQRLQLLTGGPRDAPVRQHTLRASIAWSYGLLDPAEQATFRRLAIFVGGFTLDAAEALCAEGPAEGEQLAPRPTVDCLQSLLDKSLIQATVTATAEPRFVLLETIREFGLEQLSASGELENVQERHAHIILALVEEGERHIAVRVHGVWVDRLEAEHDNVRSALTWSLTTPDGAEIGARLAIAFALVWTVRGHFSSGRAWFDLILARTDSTALSLTMQVKVLWIAAHLASRQGDYDAATRLCDRGIALGERTGDPSRLATCLSLRGIIACHQAQYAIAHDTLDRGLNLAREQGDDRLCAITLGFSSLLSCLEGEYARARSLSEESLRIIRERGGPWGVALNFDTLGSVARQQGDYSLAQSLHEEGIAAHQEVGDKWGIATSLASLGHVARALGDDSVAQARYAESLQIFREVGDRRGIALVLGNLGVLAARAGDRDRARDFLTESLTVARAVGDKRVTAAAVGQLARIDLARGDVPAAAIGYAESLRLLDAIQDKRGLSRTLPGAASVLSAMGRPESAQELRALADALLASLGTRRSPTDGASVDEQQARTPTAIRAAWSDPIPSVARDLDLHQMVQYALALLESKPAARAPRVMIPSSDAGPLSPREREIALLVARGLTNRAIAAELIIAERTADTHVSNILGKLKLKARSQIAVWAVEHRLAEP